VLAAAQVEVNKLKGGEVSEEAIGKFTAERKRLMETQLRSNSFWLGYIASALQNEQDPSGIFHYQELLKTVTVPAIRQAAKQYLGTPNQVRLVLMPEP
jgi:zinc protease